MFAQVKILIIFVLIATGAFAQVSRTKVQIELAIVVPGSVEKFVSKSQKTHVRFQFEVDSKRFYGVMCEGDWNSDALNALRSGRVSLTGAWDKFNGNDSFVTWKVERR